jgi:aryl-alcohol dehydrogenase-like predicted oxidoreductase
VLEDAPEMLALCEREELASINRGPLAMGLLSGKFDSSSRLPSDDVRGSGAAWLTAFDAVGRPQREFLDALAAIRDVLGERRAHAGSGRARLDLGASPRTIPIPGFKSVEQVQENAGALAHGPLAPESLEEIDALLGRAPTSSTGT